MVKMCENGQNIVEFNCYSAWRILFIYHLNMEWAIRSSILWKLPPLNLMDYLHWIIDGVDTFTPCMNMTTYSIVYIWIVILIWLFWNSNFVIVKLNNYFEMIMKWRLNFLFWNDRFKIVMKYYFEMTIWK